MAVTEKGFSARGQIILFNKCFAGPLFCQKLSAMPPKGYVDIINGVEKLRQFFNANEAKGWEIGEHYCNLRLSIQEWTK